MKRFLVGLAGMGLLFAAGCGGSEPPPKLAPDRTAGGAERNTEVTTCKWVPALPEDREDPCSHLNAGATLEITERADMRAESVSQQSHTCVCN